GWAAADGGLRRRRRPQLLGGGDLPAGLPRAPLPRLVGDGRAGSRPAARSGGGADRLCLRLGRLRPALPAAGGGGGAAGGMAALPRRLELDECRAVPGDDGGHRADGARPAAAAGAWAGAGGDRLCALARMVRGAERAAHPGRDGGGLRGARPGAGAGGRRDRRAAERGL
ncbi:MAG: hypothetical protein AVDCRST_MAG27-2096, partial [uncultured Craurococcus sp.]